MISAPAAISPFDHFSRGEWGALAPHSPLPLTAEDIRRIASLGDPIGLDEVDVIYRPLSSLLQLHVAGQRRVASERRRFLHQSSPATTPFVIGIAGPVAVGKSTVARLLQLLLSRWPDTPRVGLVTTDGFLLPNAELIRRGILERKGFPESYNRGALIAFMAAVKSGRARVEAPVYSHITYDIVEGETTIIDRPDILIVEGINVLQPARARAGGSEVTVSDYFDFTIYVDAEHGDIERWYVERFLQLRRTAFSRPESYFHTYATLSDEEAVSTARQIWATTNSPNMIENILPTRGRAALIFHKGSDHLVSDLYIRKL